MVLASTWRNVNACCFSKCCSRSSCGAARKSSPGWKKLGGVCSRSVSIWHSHCADCLGSSGCRGYYFVEGLSKSLIRGIIGLLFFCSQHYIAYEQETDRNPSGNNQSVSSNLDDKTLHEVYLWPFMDGIHAGTGSIMCSYNRVNNTYACENSKTMNGILKGELDFQGFVVSDWGGQHAGVDSANAGLDVTMPDSGFWGTELVTMVQNGSVSEDRVTDMATRYIIQR